MILDFRVNRRFLNFEQNLVPISVFEEGVLLYLLYCQSLVYSLAQQAFQKTCEVFGEVIFHWKRITQQLRPNFFNIVSFKQRIARNQLIQTAAEAPNVDRVIIAFRL